MLVNIKLNDYSIKESSDAGPVSANELPLLRPHILARSPSLLLEFYSTADADFEPSPLERSRTAPPLRATRTGVSSIMDPSGCSIMATWSSSSISDEEVVTNQSTELKLFQTQFSERLQSSDAPVSRYRPAGGRIMKTVLVALPCAQGRADATLTGHAHGL